MLVDVDASHLGETNFDYIFHNTQLTQQFKNYFSDKTYHAHIFSASGCQPHAAESIKNMLRNSSRPIQLNVKVRIWYGRLNETIERSNILHCND